MPTRRRDLPTPFEAPSLDVERSAPEGTRVARTEPERTPLPFARRKLDVAKRDVFRATRGVAASVASASRGPRSVRPDLGTMVARAERRPERAGPELEGIYSRRTAAGKALALEEFGGTEESQLAVERGLAYLASEQNDDGSWGFYRRPDAKYGRTQIGKSALSVLAFLASGHTQFSETNYTSNVGAAIEFLLSMQDRSTGHFGSNTTSYSHGIATYALAEAYAMTGDISLRRPLERAVTWILMNQYLQTSDRQWYGGWGYYYPDERRVADTWPRASVSVWQIMALKSAKIGGIDVPDIHLQAARVYLLNSFDSRRGNFRYTHNPERLRTRWPTLPASTPASVFGLLLLDHEADDPRIARGTDFVLERAPRSYRSGSDDDFVFNAVGNLYFWYYATLAMFLKGGEEWRTWNDTIRDLLVDAQNDDGSWTPITKYAKYSGDVDGHREYTTAMCVLMLEVYYRYFTPLLDERD